MKNDSLLQNGFTLIELLVVISIIGILSAIVLIPVQNARNVARDAVYENDIREVERVIKAYFFSNNDYPPLSVNGITDSSNLNPTLISQGHASEAINQFVTWVYAHKCEASGPNWCSPATAINIQIAFLDPCISYTGRSPDAALYFTKTKPASWDVAVLGGNFPVVCFYKD